MRRASDAWLLAPLFLLPLLAAALLAFAARSEHRDALARAADEGERAARRRLDDADTAAWLASRFTRAASARLDERRADDTTFVFEGRLAGTIRGGDGGAWTFGRALPIGLPPEAIAAGPTRLRIERGTAPADAGPIDAETATLKRLLESPDLRALRAAPLPAATKRFVTRRTKDDRSAALLDRLAAVERALDAAGGALPVGVHHIGDDDVIVLSPTRALVAPAGTEPLGPFTAGDADDPVALVWGPRDDAGALWRGSLDTPLAGTYALVARAGGAWWRAPRFVAWAVPVGAGLVAFLAIPAALAVILRRRRRLDAARARFVNELAHDLRTPLTSIRLHAELLGSGRVPEEDRAESVDVLARESERLGALLENLLDLSRLEHGVRRWKLEAVDVGDAAATAVEGFAATHAARAEDVTVAGPKGLRARTDAAALHRCLANLLDNAGKFTPAGTPIRVAWRADGGEAVLTVADDGPGIPEAERRHVFRPYERGRSAARNGAAGTGLGLALVRELAAGTHGSVRLVDGEGRGATFELRWPADD